MNSPSAVPLEAPRPSRMWLVWLLFFLQFAGVGVYFTYQNVYYREAGLSGIQIGLLSMTIAMVNMASAVGWGMISDQIGSPRVLIFIGALGALLAAQLVPVVSGFWAYLVVGMVSSIMYSAPFTLVDSTALTLLGKNRDEYGRYRLGGSFGFIAASLISGFVYQQTGLRWMFPVYGAIMGLFALTALLLPPVTVHLESRGLGEVGKMVRQQKWQVLILTIFLFWIGTNAVLQFLSVALDTMGGGKSLIGLVNTLAAVVEIPFMYYSGHLLRRFGPVRLLIVAILLNMARNFLFGWMPAPAWAVPINLLNGPGYVLFWTSAVTYANKMAPPGRAGTAQSLIASTTSLAGMVSSLLSGWLFDQLGPGGIFVVMGFLALAALIIFVAGNLYKREAPNPVSPM